MIQTLNLTKTYPNGLQALKGVNLTLEKGEIHSIVGENGAGKSTLMNILFGLIKPSSGIITIDNEEVNISHPEKAIELGIGMVHQHFMIVPSLTVMENVVLGSEKEFTNKFGKIDYTAVKKKVGHLIDKLNLSLSPGEIVANLPIGKQQLVEILKVLYKEPEIIILDEPTAVLAPTEVDEFLKFVINLKKHGKTIVFISHRLKEVFSISDKITILRKGRTVGSFSANEVSEDIVANLMIGENFEIDTNSIPKETGKIQLSISNLSVRGNMLHNISFNIRSGEIVGIAGVEGNGQEELFLALSKRVPGATGSIMINDKELLKTSLYEKRRSGISYVTDDRVKDGLAIDRTILENGIAYHHIDQKLGKFLLNYRESRKLVKNIIEKYDVRGAENLGGKVRALSGGNMQKLLVGRELSNNPKLLVASQPTAGVDIAAKALIHKSMRALAAKGNSVLVISGDLEELMSLSNRILVIYRGKIAAEFTFPDYDVKELSYYMTGLKESC